MGTIRKLIAEVGIIVGILDIFDRFRDTIFLKEDCELERRVQYLEKLKEQYPDNKNINEQLFMAQKGLIGEKEIVYQLQKSNIGMYVLHDVNIVYEDLTAQIDFIIITPWCCYFVECKNLIGNITVNDKGDFIREYSFKGKKIKKGMESPYRQVQAQRDVYKKIWLKRLGKIKSFLFEKNFENTYRVLVVAANGENILNTNRAPKELKYNVIKADALVRKLEFDREHSNKDTWDNQKEMEKWAKYLLSLNSEREPYKIDIQTSKVEKVDKTTIKESLIEFRKQRSIEKNIPAYYVFNNTELDKIVEIMPKSIEELRDTKILTDVKINSHGKEIIDIING